MIRFIVAGFRGVFLFCFPRLILNSLLPGQSIFISQGISGEGKLKRKEKKNTPLLKKAV